MKTSLREYCGPAARWAMQLQVARRRHLERPMPCAFMVSQSINSERTEHRTLKKPLGRQTCGLIAGNVPLHRSCSCSLRSIRFRNVTTQNNWRTIAGTFSHFGSGGAGGRTWAGSAGTSRCPSHNTALRSKVTKPSLSNDFKLCPRVVVKT